MRESLPARHYIWEAIRKSNWPYRTYLRLTSRDNRYPCKNTWLTLEGYPRSANTFCLYLARELYPGKLISSHIHNISSIKAALRVGVPCVILMRNGVDSAISLAQKKGIPPEDYRMINSFLHQWLTLYRFVSASLDQLSLCEFGQVVQMPEKFIVHLASLKGLSLSHGEAVDIVTSAKGKIEAKEANKSKDGSSLPQAERKIAKKAYLEVVKTLPSSSEVDAEFQTLKEKAVNLSHV